MTIKPPIVLLIACFLAMILWNGRGQQLSDVVRAERAKSKATIYDFNGNGMLSSITKPDGTTQRYEYDDQGHLDSHFNNDVRTDYKYDANGNLFEARNDLGTTRYTYDPFDRLEKLTYEYPFLKESINYTYNEKDQLATKSIFDNTGAEKLKTSYDYDQIGRLTLVNSSDVKIKYDYDETQNTVTRTLPNEVKSIYKYDWSDRLEKLDHYLGKDNIESFHYQYDDAGRLSEQAEKSAAGSLTTDYKYNSFGNLGTVSYSDGRRFSFDYSGDGTLKNIQTPSESLQIQRDNTGFVRQMGNSQFITDEKDRISEIRDSISDTRMKYDSADRLSSLSTQKGDVSLVYGADGGLLNSRIGDRQNVLVPDPFGPGGKSLSMPSPDRTLYSPVRDLSVEIDHSHIGINLGDGFGNPAEHLTGDFQRPDPIRPLPDLSQLRPPQVSIERIELPKPDFTSIGEKYGQNVQDLLDRGHTLPMPSAADMASSDSHWDSGRYLQDPYYSQFRPGSSPTSEMDPTLKAGLELVKAYIPHAEVMDDLFQFGVSGFVRAEGGIIDQVNKQLDDTLTKSGMSISPQPSIAKVGNDMQPSFNKVGSDLLSEAWDHFGTVIDKVAQSIEQKSVASQIIKDFDGMKKYDAQHFLVESAGNIKDFYDMAKDHFDKALNFTEFAQSIYEKFQPPGTKNENHSQQGFNLFSALDNLGSQFQPKGVKFDKTAQFLGQIGKIQGVIFDPQTKRLSLIGDGNPSLPPVNADDFITALQVVYGDHDGPRDPMFTLDPADPNNPSGEWLHAIHRPELLSGTHMGDVMLRADWVLKQYAFGVVAGYDGVIAGIRHSSVNNYVSYFERVQRNPGAFAQGSLCSRFWILPLEMTLAKSGNTLVFVQSTMQVESRRMEAGEGGLSDSPNKVDADATHFAQFFTDNYDKLARESPVLEEVRQCAKVVALVKWLKTQGMGVNDYQIDWTQIPRTKPTPNPIHSLSVSASAALWGLHNITAVGGVELKPILTTNPGSVGLPGWSSSIPQRSDLSLDQIHSGSTTLRIAALPLTGGSSDLLKNTYVETQDGVTYIADNQKQVRSAFDEQGNVATYDYDGERRLSGVHLRTHGGWLLDGTTSASGGKSIRVTNPKHDKFTYDFRPDGRITTTKLNDKSLARYIWNEAGDTVTTEHIRTVEDYPIGDLSGQPKLVEKVVSREKTEFYPGEWRYTRMPGNATNSNLETISFKFTPKEATIEGTGIAPIHFVKQNESTTIVQGPSGKVEYQFDLTNRAVRSIRHENGDFIEFPANAKAADGSVIVMRARKGAVQAEIETSTNKVAVLDFRGIRTTYTYASGKLQRIESPVGATSYEYEKGRVSRVNYPDGSALCMHWTEGLDVTRLKVWREFAPPGVGGR